MSRQIVEDADAPKFSIRAWLARWQEPIVWVPIVLAVMLAAYYAIPRIDPRSGMDGWGSVWGMLVVVLAVVLAGFLAWLLQSTYHLILTDQAERELIDSATGMDRDRQGKPLGLAFTQWQPVAIIALDRIQWLVLFALILSKLAP